MADIARLAARQPWLSASLRIPRQQQRILQPSSTSSSPLGLGLGLGFGRGGTSIRAVSSAKRRYKQSSFKDKDRFRSMEGKASFLLPLTIVPPPFWRFPRSPVKFAHMLYLLGQNWVTRVMSVMGVYFVSMPSTLSMPRFRQNKSSALPAAKALHVQMSEAVASGDKDTLRRICSGGLFQTLAGVVDSRPRGVTAEWELVRYTDTLRYPRLADFRVSYQPVTGSRNMRLIRQAVVSIASVQRLAKFNTNNNTGVRVPVPGSDVEKHMLEHIVLQSEVNTTTWIAEPWTVWGTLPEMPYETIRNDSVLFAEAMARPHTN